MLFLIQVFIQENAFENILWNYSHFVSASMFFITKYTCMYLYWLLEALHYWTLWLTVKPLI